MIKRRAPGSKAAVAPEEAMDPPKGGEANERIGRELRAMFDDVVAAPVPDKFRQLLDELERKVRKP